MSKGLVDLSVSRRVLLKNTAATAAAAAMPSLSMTAAAEEIKKLEKEGWSKHPVACTMCGAFCGLLAMKKEGAVVSESTVRIFPNPGHPQQGYCGRGAAAMWVWNHPQYDISLVLRLQQMADFPVRFSQRYRSSVHL